MIIWPNDATNTYALIGSVDLEIFVDQVSIWSINLLWTQACSKFKLVLLSFNSISGVGAEKVVLEDCESDLLKPFICNNNAGANKSSSIYNPINKLVAEIAKKTEAKFVIVIFGK